MCKKYDISPFVRDVQEIGYLDVYDTGINTIGKTGGLKSQKCRPAGVYELFIIYNYPPKRIPSNHYARTGQDCICYECWAVLYAGSKCYSVKVGMRPTLEPKHYFSEGYTKLYAVPISNSIYVGMRQTVKRKFVSMHVGNSPKNKLKI